MAKGAPIGFRVEPKLKEALEKAARYEDRSVSSLVTIVLKSWLKDKGYYSG